MSKQIFKNHDPDLVKRAKSFKKDKALGQNFLLDANILDDIVSYSLDSVDPEQPETTVVEIGAGIGFLTERLAPLCKKLVSVELDADCETYLKLIQAIHPHFSYLRQDFLQTKIADLIGAEQAQAIRDGNAEKIKIVANIPYQISSKILLQLLGDIEYPDPNHERNLISEINILVQKEFADKLTAPPGIKAHSSLTLLVNYWAEVEQLFDVSANAFMPAPKVDSCFIKISLREQPAVDLTAIHPDRAAKEMRRLIKAIYANRRKKLSNALVAAGYPQNLIDSLDLGNLRGETMSLAELADFTSKICGRI